ncbi:4,5-DOPA-extradiol-dioxygenase [Sphingomonas nostoxanthinifaciens]|uniref:4,5-DOPA-extradiol-dioxygenase n=1 Tax=Sphingomonas nostoxanthinifaciens TaxID=2872652 RepID=UPI001CC1F0FC|nr:4,5-DOPA dioxygenase extradiol [Sphingomonas nostoxanthinifaciens]UAK25646.1 4,5-DOPA dioxygenase extradiol [Sphingomonas nostoxanthinifaciens]
MARLPTIFFGHGSPIIAMKENTTTAAWRAILANIPRPRAVLCISAHWVTRGIGITAQPYPPTIHDFGGFPREMHEFQYPALGDPSLAARVRDLLAPAPVVLTDRWGFDHGCWTVLMKILPDADVPVIQLSLDAECTPQQHFDIGRRLRPLRDEGVLLIGSGNIVHNLSGVVRRDGVPPHDYAAHFSKAIKDAIRSDEPRMVIDYEALGPDAARSVPTPDHFWPLLYVLGARHEDDVPSFWPDFIEYGSIDMTSVTLAAPLAA